MRLKAATTISNQETTTKVMESTLIRTITTRAASTQDLQRKILNTDTKRKNLMARTLLKKEERKETNQHQNKKDMSLNLRRLLPQRKSKQQPRLPITLLPNELISFEWKWKLCSLIISVKLPTREHEPVSDILNLHLHMQNIWWYWERNLSLFKQQMDYGLLYLSKKHHLVLRSAWSSVNPS